MIKKNFKMWEANNLKIIMMTVLMNYFSIKIMAQNLKSYPSSLSKVWVADNGDGTYKNPVLNADYSDPDAIRVANDFYMVSSSFEDIPGLPILHSNDLVNWRIIGHGLLGQPPFDHFSIPRHGDGVWAPSIRYHDKEFYIYYPDPDYGIYVIKSKKPAGPWSNPALVEGGKGLIDPCPLWDDDGQLYLVHAFAGSRAGIKSLLVVQKLNSAGTKVTDQGKIVYDGHETDPTIEGPKFYKRHGYYYIFAPAGGVSAGWQLVLRSKNIYGPYERKVVMDQGSTTVNGPHQGAWLTTQTGESWFLHFQDKGVYGRVVHLQPMKWVNDWPVIGSDKNHSGKGEPVLTYKKPDVGKIFPVETPAESDEFNEPALGLQWQWMANEKPTWYFMDPANGTLRLFSAKIPENAKNLWDVPNVLLQKFPSDEFMITTRMNFKPNIQLEGEEAGLVIMGRDYANLALKSMNGNLLLVYNTCKNADKGIRKSEEVITKVKDGHIYLRVKVSKSGLCKFSYSSDGTYFNNISGEFLAKSGQWTGAKAGLFCTRESETNDSGYADFDWFRVDALPKKE